MTTDIVHHQQSELAQQMEYARVVSSGAMLPQAYRGKPADILLAVGLGQAMGLSPAESLYRIDVIQGKPTASAELIAANVRKAGHRLRVQGNDDSCTASIYRSDDPDFEFKVTRDADWAKAMGLNTKDNYKKQPGTMLQWRAITAVARLACPEALYGVAYVREELDDMGPRTEAAPRASSGDFMQATVVEQPTGDTGRGFPTESEEQPADPMQGGETFPAEQNRLAAMFAEFGRAGFTTDARSAEGRQARLDYCTNVLGREVASSKDMSAGEVERVIDSLKVDAADREAQA